MRTKPPQGIAALTVPPPIAPNYWGNMLAHQRGMVFSPDQEAILAEQKRQEEAPRESSSEESK